MSEEQSMQETGGKGISIGSIFSHETLDPEIEKKVNAAVAEIILRDDRFHEPDIETIDALRDWVRAEAICDIAFQKFLKNDTSASIERMFRHAQLHKTALRDEIFGKFKGKKAKKEEIDYSNKILIDTGIITPAESNVVDILEDK